MPLIALLGAFVWGILSIVLSPCHLASIPLIVGFVGEQGKISVKKAFFLSLLFSFGIFLTIAIIGIITGLLGRILGDVGTWGNYLVAAVFFIFGLNLLDVIKIPFFSGSTTSEYKRKGYLAAYLIGLIFGIGIGPCTFAYMAPVLGIAFKVGSTNMLYSFSIVLTFAAGHCSVILLAGTFTEVLENYLNWDKKSKGLLILKKICGALVILGGFYLIYSVLV
ncbi:cytochrome c biogenesis CcdA family protein [Elusimicrobiota bacterium]